jgi:hypothetical protein
VADFPHGGTTYHPERTVGDYAPAEGILFPRAMSSTGWGFKGGATVTKVEVNVPLPNERFEMPDRVG